MAGQGAATKGSDIRGGGERDDTINRAGGSEVIESGIDKAGLQVIPGGLDCPPLVLDGETPRKAGGERSGMPAGHRALPAIEAPGVPSPCGTRLQAIRQRLDGEAAQDRGAPAGERRERRTRDNALEISLVNDPRKVDGVTAQIGEFCASHNLAPGIALALNLAVDQLLSGTMVYGYDNDVSHRIEIIVCLESDWLVVVIADDGKAIETRPTLEPRDGALLEAISAGARRLFFARRLVEGVHYRRIDGCNVVTLTKCARL